MATSSEFELIYGQIVRASSPQDVFGQLGNGSVSERESEVRHTYRHLARTVHPDLYSDPRLKHMADEAMSELGKLYKQALDQVEDNTYDQKSPVRRSSGKSNSTSEFTAGSTHFQVTGESIGGDFCQVLFAEATYQDGKSENVVLKLPYDPKDNDLLANEAEILAAVTHKSLPIFLDTFGVSDDRRVNVLRRVSESRDLVEVKKRYPAGLPPEHVVWILDRLLSVVGFLHISNVIHAAIEPANILVVPGNHNAVLIDYLLAISNANQKGACYKGVNSFTAPEVANDPKRPPHPAADIYSLGLTMLDLLGGDILTQSFPSSVDRRIVSFIQSFLVKDPARRASDAWGSYQTLKLLRKEVFGASNQFLPLNL